jgi:phosphatidylglycerophosphate synthase
LNRTGSWLVFVDVTLLDLLAVRNVGPARPVQRGTPADRVTFVRACLSCVVAVLVALAYAGQPHVVLTVTLTAVALVLDAVDGWVARRTRSTAFGAVFDMEVDAFLILVLSVAVAGAAGWWVLLIGSARYLLLLATRVWPWLGDPIPPRRWAKGVAALQGVVLVVVLADVLPQRVAALSLAVALLLLATSFGHQVWWLRTRGSRP